jgi:hypothetical protein
MALVSPSQLCTITAFPDWRLHGSIPAADYAAAGGPPQTYTQGGERSCSGNPHAPVTFRLLCLGCTTPLFGISCTTGTLVPLAQARSIPHPPSAIRLDRQFDPTPPLRFRLCVPLPLG